MPYVSRPSPRARRRAENMPGQTGNLRQFHHRKDSHDRERARYNFSAPPPWAMPALRQAQCPQPAFVRAMPGENAGMGAMRP